MLLRCWVTTKSKLKRKVVRRRQSTEEMDGGGPTSGLDFGFVQNASCLCPPLPVKGLSLDTLWYIFGPKLLILFEGGSYTWDSKYLSMSSSHSPWIWRETGFSHRVWVHQESCKAYAMISGQDLHLIGNSRACLEFCFRQSHQSLAALAAVTQASTSAPHSHLTEAAGLRGFLTFTKAPFPHVPSGDNSNTAGVQP